MRRTRVADPLREVADALTRSTTFDGRISPELVDRLRGVADLIDLEHARRVANCRREVRRHFARYMRSVIADYERGVSRRNRNHAHCIETIGEDGVFGHARCSACHRSIGPYYRFCSHCGAKITGTDYEEEGE